MVLGNQQFPYSKNFGGIFSYRSEQTQIHSSLIYV
jgi:hypothetical protein